MATWQTDSFSGLKVPTKPHLVPCLLCDGAGELLADSAGNANDPTARVFECEDCGGSGQRRCADDGCCDHDPPEDD